MRIQIAFGVVVILAAPAHAQGVPDPSTDREFSAKLTVCNECHGANGVRKNATIPVIGGQPESYLLKQLHDFERGDRHDEVMPWMAKTLTPQEREIAAAYFAKQKWPARSAAGASTPPPPGICMPGLSCGRLPWCQAEIQRFDRMIGPEGKELPPGHGRPGRVSVLRERHHQRNRRHGREDPADGRHAEPEWLRSGGARVSPGKETQLVLSASLPRDYFGGAGAFGIGGGRGASSM